MPLPISGFTAIPNPYMIPFMGTQTAVIGMMFGITYQGYKRKISAMSNEDFNKLDVIEYAMSEMRKLTQATPQMEQMFAEMRPMVQIMAKELGNLLKELPDIVSSTVDTALSSDGRLGSKNLAVAQFVTLPVAPDVGHQIAQHTPQNQVSSSPTDTGSGNYGSWTLKQLSDRRRWYIKNNKEIPGELTHAYQRKLGTTKAENTQGNTTVSSPKPNVPIQQAIKPLSRGNQALMDSYSKYGALIVKATNAIAKAQSDIRTFNNISSRVPSVLKQKVQNIKKRNEIIQSNQKSLITYKQIFNSKKMQMLAIPELRGFVT